MVDRKIAECILRAQNASDGGKGIRILPDSRKGWSDTYSGYARKDCMIMNALSLVAANKSSFKFSVQRDREGIAPFLVYFETRIPEGKYQVSFHSFDMRLAKYVNSSFRMKWDRKDSRFAACRIYSYYCPNGEYTDLYRSL